MLLESFRVARWVSEPKAIDNSNDPNQLRKQIARTFLRVGQPAEAFASAVAGSRSWPQKGGSEAAWLLRPRLPPGGRHGSCSGGDGSRRVVPALTTPGGRSHSVRGRGPLQEMSLRRDLPGTSAGQPAYPDLPPRAIAPDAAPPGLAAVRSHRPQSHSRDQGSRRARLGGDIRAFATFIVRSLIEYAFGTNDRYADDDQPQRARSISSIVRALVLSHGGG